MYNHFVQQLSDARLMDVNKRYKKKLNSIDKQRNFIILRTLHGRNYETEMNRSMLPEKLYYIYENLCFTTGVKASKPYKEKKTLAFTNKKIKSCRICGGILTEDSAELTCVNCSGIELIDGTIFEEQQKRKNTNTKIHFL